MTYWFSYSIHLSSVLDAQMSGLMVTDFRMYNHVKQDEIPRHGEDIGLPYYHDHITEFKHELCNIHILLINMPQFPTMHFFCVISSYF